MTPSSGSGGPDVPTATDPIPDVRLGGDLPIASPESAAALVPETATLLVSGFGGVGYPKLVPEALAAADDARELTVVSGGGRRRRLSDRSADAPRRPHRTRRERDRHRTRRRGPRGRSPRERAEALIEVADPAFREPLDEYRERADTEGGNTAHDLDTAFSWQ